jgi:hypothetical protein
MEISSGESLPEPSQAGKRGVMETHDNIYKGFSIRRRHSAAWRVLGANAG